MDKEIFSSSKQRRILSTMVDKLVELYNEGNLLDYLEENMRNVEFLIDIHGNYIGGRFSITYNTYFSFHIEEKGAIILVNTINGSTLAELLPDDVFGEISIFLEENYPFSSNVSRPGMRSPGRSMRSASRLSSRSTMARPTSSLRSATRSSDLRRKRK